jgi:hypothetical protein
MPGPAFRHLAAACVPGAQKKNLESACFHRYALSLQVGSTAAGLEIRPTFEPPEQLRILMMLSETQQSPAMVSTL